MAADSRQIFDDYHDDHHREFDSCSVPEPGDVVLERRARQAHVNGRSQQGSAIVDFVLVPLFFAILQLARILREVTDSG
jgi:hypothetical protein